MVQSTNGFHVSNICSVVKSQMTSKCGKNKKVAHEGQPSMSLNQMFLPHFDIFHNLLYGTVLLQHGINLVYEIKSQNVIHGDIFYTSVSSSRLYVINNQSKLEQNSTFI